MLYGGFGTTQDQDCVLNPAMRELYAAYRTFGTPGATYISQGQGDVGGVMVPGVGGGPPTIKFMDFSAAEAVVQGRHMPPGPSDAMFTDGGLVPARAMGYYAAPVRTEQYLSTVSEGLVTPRGGEFIAPPPTFGTPYFSENLMPVSACQVRRSEQSKQLDILQKALLKKKLQQLGHQSAVADGLAM